MDIETPYFCPSIIRSTTKHHPRCAMDIFFVSRSSFFTHWDDVSISISSFVPVLRNKTTTTKKQIVCKVEIRIAYVFTHNALILYVIRIFL
jgi:hypothetical protein